MEKNQSMIWQWTGILAAASLSTRDINSNRLWTLLGSFSFRQGDGRWQVINHG